MTAGLTVGEALRSGMARLAAAGVGNPGLDARVLLAHVMGVDGSALLRDRGVIVDAEAWERVLARRERREPVALITGRAGFWTFEVEVSADTLVPRGDSETLIEAAVVARARGAVRRVLDLGTGTGCLLLAALVEFPEAWGVGVDRSAATAAVARRNVLALGMGARAAVVVGDWAAAVAGTFDLVLSNPPYIVRGDLAGLMPEVARFEPVGALDGGVDGLAAYRELLAVLPRVLAPEGLAVFEVGAGQAADVGQLARKAGFAVRMRTDLGRVERAVLLERDTG